MFVSESFTLALMDLRPPPLSVGTGATGKADIAAVSESAREPAVARVRPGLEVAIVADDIDGFPVGVTVPVTATTVLLVLGGEPVVFNVVGTIGILLEFEAEVDARVVLVLLTLVGETLFIAGVIGAAFLVAAGEEVVVVAALL